MSVYPNRKSPRAYFHDYSGGIYFVTICTEEMHHYFGWVVGSEMKLSRLGRFVDYAIKTLGTYYKYCEILHWVVMPNHIHILVMIRESDAPDARECVPTFRTALSVVVGGLKGKVTMYARRNDILFSWQSRYHDRIVRTQDEMNRISEYITYNPDRWKSDCFNI